MASGDVLKREMVAGTPNQIVFADHGGGGFTPTGANDLRFATRTNVQITLTGLANGAARQSDDFDLGENWAPAYRIRAAQEIAATPNAGDVIEIYPAPSSSSTPATGNPGGVSGADSAYAGYAANLADSVKQLDGPFLFVCTADDTPVVQIAEIGIWFPSERFGSLVVKNESGAAFHSDDVEIHIVFDPIVEQIQ